MVLSLASLQLCPPNEEYPSTISMILDHVQLTRGITVVYEANPEALHANPLLQNYLPFEDLPELPIDGDVAKGLDMLSDWNNARRSDIGSFEYRRKVIANKIACDKGIFWLREFHSKCNSSDSRGYVLGWPEIAGEEYLIAVRERDSVSLAILAHWGAMVEQAATEVWWARKVGSMLFDEISEILANEADESAFEIMTGVGHLMQRAQAHYIASTSLQNATSQSSEKSRSSIQSSCVSEGQSFRQCILSNGLRITHE